MKSLTENINLSILEIFSVLFPGGALMLLCWQVADIQVVIQGLLPNIESEWQLSIAFLGTAYFLGYVLFYISSFFDFLYDYFKKSKKPLIDKVIALKTKAFGYDNMVEINAFKWSCAVLLAQQPAMYNVVERFMAASKFFRSMTLVLCIAVLGLCCQCKFLGAFIALIFVAISFLNYMRQRSKAVEAAYEYVVTIDNMK